MISGIEGSGWNCDTCSRNVFRGNLIRHVGQGGLGAWNAFDNDFVANTFCRTSMGLALGPAASGNRVYRNSFVAITGEWQCFDSGGAVQWDNGREGNYWSEYHGSDLNGDGIGDTPYEAPVNILDRYPLMAPHREAPGCDAAVAQMAGGGY